MPAADHAGQDPPGSEQAKAAYADYLLGLEMIGQQEYVNKHPSKVRGQGKQAAEGVSTISKQKRLTKQRR